jgi:hypothetical protein
MYEGVSKSSWIESITKYMVPALIGNCCPFQSGHISCLCSGSGIYTTAGSTAGTDILEFHVRVSMIVPEFQECPENDVLIPVILFLETRIISGSYMRWLRRAGNHGDVCSSWEFLHSHNSVLQHVVKVCQPVLNVLSFRMFSVDPLHQML